jgi:hypothetical protein
VVFYTRQIEAYEPYLFPDDDPLTLQNYVLDKIVASGASMRGMANKKTEAKGVFKVSELELTATGTYSQLVDLVDRLEHGDRIVRFEKCRLLATKTQIVLDCIVNGLVKSRGTQPTDDIDIDADAADDLDGAPGGVLESVDGPERWFAEDLESPPADDLP